MIRLGTTSYILPDDIIPNVRYLAPQVSDVELVLFESREASNLPSPRDVDILRDIAHENNLTYTVHFPLDVYPGSADEAIRRRSVETYRRIISLTQGLEPFAYVLHLTPEAWGEVPSSDMPRWLGQLDRSLDELLTGLGLPSQLFCAETLSYPFDLVLPLVLKHQLSVTLDVGHLWLMDYDADSIAKRLLPLSPIVHIHGVKEGKDHQSLDVGDRKKVRAFLSLLAKQDQSDGKERVLTMEVFDKDAFWASKTLLETQEGSILRTE